MSGARLLRLALTFVPAAVAVMTPVAAWGQASPAPFTSATRYDLANRVVGTIAPDPDGSGPLHYAAVRNTYDVDGRLTRVEKGELATWQSEAVLPSDWEVYTTFTVFSEVDTTYDGMDRKLTDTISAVGAGHSLTPYSLTQYSYDPVGRLDCTVERMNPAAFGSLPASACTLGTEGSYGPDRISRNTYDDAGQLLKVTKAYGTPLQQDYVTYTYSLNGKQTSVKDANGNLASLTYDGFDRQSQWNFPDKVTTGAVSSTDYEAYTYDANGNRLTLRKRDGRTISYVYDALNRVTSKTYPGGGARPVYYAYDLRGLQTAARFDSASGADAVTSTWNGFGEPATSTTSMSGTSRTLENGYDIGGNRISLKYPDGLAIYYHRDGLDRLYYAEIYGGVPLLYPNFDAAGRMSALLRWHSAGSWGFGSSYGYDGISRVSSIANGVWSSGHNLTETFAYNPASQITSRTRDNDLYAFTGYVNVSRSYAANGLNQYTTAGPASFTYDANGNLTSDGTTSYTYDIENRLVTASNGAVLTYDPLGRLSQTSGTSTGTTQLLYDGDALVAEYDAAGTMLKRYVHSDGEDDPLVEYDGASTASPLYLFADHQGSIFMGADANGQATRFNRYDEYGIPASTNTGRFQYTGQAWLPDLGMYYYKARIYSPTLGRFMQTDPIGYKDQQNLYAYVGNDPIDGRDPTGLESPSYSVYGRAPDVDLSRVPSWYWKGAEAVLTVTSMLDGAGEAWVLGRALLERRIATQVVRDAAAREAAAGVAAASRVVASERAAIAKAGISALGRGEGKAIIGAGTKTSLRDAGRLAAKYGGDAGDYAKVTSRAVRTSDGASVQVHAYENVATGKIYEPKLKIQ